MDGDKETLRIIARVAPEVDRSPGIVPSPLTLLLERMYSHRSGVHIRPCSSLDLRISVFS